MSTLTECASFPGAGCTINLFTRFVAQRKSRARVSCAAGHIRIHRENGITCLRSMWLLRDPSGALVLDLGQLSFSYLITEVKCIHYNNLHVHWLYFIQNRTCRYSLLTFSDEIPINVSCNVNFLPLQEVSQKREVSALRAISNTISHGCTTGEHMLFSKGIQECQMERITSSYHPDSSVVCGKTWSASRITSK